MKYETHYGLLMYPRSQRPYLAVDPRYGHPEIFSRRSAAVEARRTRFYKKPHPKVVRVRIEYETPK